MPLKRERFPRDIPIPVFLLHVRFVHEYQQDSTAGFFSLVTDRLISYSRTHARKEFLSTRTHPWSVDRFHLKDVWTCKPGRKRTCKVNLQQNHTCAADPAGHWSPSSTWPANMIAIKLISMLHRHMWAHPPNIGNMQCNSARQQQMLR